MSAPEQPRTDAPIEEPPPVLGTWKNLYLFLIAELAVVVLLLWALTRWAE